MTLQEIAKQIKIGKAETKTIPMPGFEIRYLAEGEDTNKRYALLEVHVGPDVLFAPPHVHQNEDEWFYVVEGELTAQVGEKRLTASEGSFLSLPRGIPHAAANAAAKPGKYLLLVSPAGFEPFFEEVSPILAKMPAFPAEAIDTFGQAPVPPEAEAAIAAMMAVWGKYSLQMPE